MTTSGTYTFGTDTEAVDVVTEAFERCGKEPGEISAQQLDSARRSLMFMLSDWANDGPHLFDIYLYTITLTEATQSYNLPVNTIYITDAQTRQTLSDGTTQDLPIGPISRREYWALPNKAQFSNRPTQFYFQRTITPVIYPWPVLGEGYTCSLLLNLMRMSQDVGNFANTLDAPQRAFDAVASGLAVRLATKYAPERKQDLMADYKDSYARFIGEDRERVPLRITIDNPWGP